MKCKRCGGENPLSHGYCEDENCATIVWEWLCSINFTQPASEEPTGLMLKALRLEDALVAARRRTEEEYEQLGLEEEDE